MNTTLLLQIVSIAFGAAAAVLWLMSALVRYPRDYGGAGDRVIPPDIVGALKIQSLFSGLGAACAAISSAAQAYALWLQMAGQ